MKEFSTVTNRIQTYTGRWVAPLSIRPEDIDIQDIAHALSMQCRFGGHSRYFYSVAQHSVAVSWRCDPQDALWGLLHDAAEAYLVDLPRPIKHAPGFGEVYQAAEESIMRAVGARFGLSPADMPESVRDADTRMLVTEARDLLPDGSTSGVSVEPYGFPVLPWLPFEAKTEFLIRFNQIWGLRPSN